MERGLRRLLNTPSQPRGKNQTAPTRKRQEKAGVEPGRQPGSRLRASRRPPAGALAPRQFVLMEIPAALDRGLNPKRRRIGLYLRPAGQFPQPFQSYRIQLRGQFTGQLDPLI